jgi:diguanylate cyclase (GGDEF)-like protein
MDRPEPPPETSGMTTRLVLLYVERHAGAPAVDILLEKAGMTGFRERLLDDDAWFSWDDKIRLFDAATEVLGDPHVMVDIGRAVLAHEVAPGLKLALKALGAPRLVYRNIVRANGRFCKSHDMRVVDDRAGHVVIEFEDITGGRSHRLECEYVAGLLSSIPELFGWPAATVEHRACAADGADLCRFDVSWERAPGAARRAVSRVGRALTGSHRRERQLEALLSDLEDTTARLTGSLQDVVSELRIEDVLAKVTANARAAVGGSDFALLLDGRVQSASSGVDADTIAALEGWVGSRPHLLQHPQLVDDLTRVEGVSTGLRSLCSAPLIARGEAVGLLVALAGQERVFLPRDLAVLEGYAAQAAIAVMNARLYAAQEALATRDPLTGLLNHRAFHEELAAELSSGSPAVIVLDLDGFKQVNDTDGHAAGDRLLRAVAAALHTTVRAGDLVCRIGGDEFAVLLPGADIATATTVAERAADAIDLADPRTTTSYGIATTPADGATKDEVIEAADARLYASKRTRRGGPARELARAYADLLVDLVGPKRASDAVRDTGDPTLAAVLSYIEHQPDRS